MRTLFALFMAAGLLLAACGGSTTPTPPACGGKPFQVGEQAVLGYNEAEGFSAEFFSGMEGPDPWVALGILLNSGEYFLPSGTVLTVVEGGTSFLRWEDSLEVAFSLCGGKYYYRVTRGDLREFDLPPTPSPREQQA